MLKYIIAFIYAFLHGLWSGFGYDKKNKRWVKK